MSEGFPISGSILGYRVIESVFLEEDDPYEAPRSWRERWLPRPFLTAPWEPWVRTKTLTRKIPYRGALKFGPNTIIMHPATVAALRSMPQLRAPQ